MKTEEALDKFMTLHEILTKNVTELANQVLLLAKQVHELQDRIKDIEEKHFYGC